MENTTIKLSTVVPACGGWLKMVKLRQGYTI
jgi:hypothetical protein